MVSTRLANIRMLTTTQPNVGKAAFVSFSVLEAISVYYFVTRAARVISRSVRTAHVQ